MSGIKQTCTSRHLIEKTTKTDSNVVLCIGFLLTGDLQGQKIIQSKVYHVVAYESYAYIVHV